MSKIGQIVESLSNLSTDAIGLTDHKGSDMAKDRMSICNACEFGGNSKPEDWNGFCKVCSCFMPGKTTVKDSFCDLSKW